MQKPLITLTLLIFVLAGCRPDCSQRYLPESYKPYEFKAGSYWVFKDSAYSVLDTLYLVDLRHEVVETFGPVKCTGKNLEEMYKATIIEDADTIIFYTNTAVGFEVLAKSLNIQGNILDPDLTQGNCNGSSMCVQDRHFKHSRKLL